MRQLYIGQRYYEMTSFSGFATKPRFGVIICPNTKARLRDQKWK